jgi:hypothetical protein
VKPRVIDNLLAALALAIVMVAGPLVVFHLDKPDALAQFSEALRGE